MPILSRRCGDNLGDHVWRPILIPGSNNHALPLSSGFNLVVELTASCQPRSVYTLEAHLRQIQPCFPGWRRRWWWRRAGPAALAGAESSQQSTRVGDVGSRRGSRHRGCRRAGQRWLCQLWQWPVGENVLEDGLVHAFAKLQPDQLQMTPSVSDTTLHHAQCSNQITGHDTRPQLPDYTGTVGPVKQGGIGCRATESHKNWIFGANWRCSTNCHPKPSVQLHQKPAQAQSIRV